MTNEAGLKLTTQKANVVRILSTNQTPKIFVILFTSVVSLPFLPQFFPYILLSLAILLYIPALFWRFTAAPHLSSDLNFIMEELDRFYNRAIRLAKNLASLDSKDAPEDTQR